MSATGVAKVKQQKVIKVKINDLMTDVFVRAKTDQEYVIALSMLYDAGTEMEPIKITKSMRVIDGRHRIEASILAGKEEISAYVVDDMPRKEMIVMAMNSNLGHSKPPTKEDIVIAVESMLKAGASESWIRSQVPFPRQVMDTYLGEARGSIQRQKLGEAKRMLAEGATIEEAANQAGVTIDAIRTRILGEKGKERAYKLSAHIMQRITYRNRAVGQSNRFVFDTAFKGFEDGELTREQVMEIADAVEKHGAISMKAADDFRRRFLQRIS